jgi:hypothetical protein
MKKVKRYGTMFIDTTKKEYAISGKDMYPKLFTTPEAAVSGTGSSVIFEVMVDLKIAKKNEEL